MHRKTLEVRSRLSRVNQIIYRPAQLTNEIDSTLVQEQQSTMNAETAAVRAASLELQTVLQFGDVFSPVPLPPAFTLPEVMALHFAPYARVYTSIIGEVPPTETHVARSVRKRRARRDTGQKHKLAGARKPRRCLTCVKNRGPNIYTCSGQSGQGKCQYYGTATS